MAAHAGEDLSRLQRSPGAHSLYYLALGVECLKKECRASRCPEVCGAITLHRRLADYPFSVPRCICRRDLSMVSGTAIVDIPGTAMRWERILALWAWSEI